MKTKSKLFILTLVILLLATSVTACSTASQTTSEEEFETQIALAMETLEAAGPTNTPTTDPRDATIEAAEVELATAQAFLTEQAAELAATQSELATQQAEPTEEPSTPTNTPKPTLAATSTPEYMVWVEAVAKLNLFKHSSDNDAGYPIMVIAEPRVQFEKGERILVDKRGVRADGGAKFYLVFGPRGAGLYVRSQDVNIVTP